MSFPNPYTSPRPGGGSMPNMDLGRIADHLETLADAQHLANLFAISQDEGLSVKDRDKAWGIVRTFYLEDGDEK